MEGMREGMQKLLKFLEGGHSIGEAKAKFAMA